MIVEDPESFKAWMTTVLEPMCDADPEALAKYVYALVKKDKSADALKQSMVSQLEVFLEKETVGFVDLLFRKLENQATISLTASLKSVKEEDIADDYIPVSQSSSNSRPTSPLSGTVAAVTGSLPPSPVDISEVDLGDNDLNINLDKSSDLSKETTSGSSSGISCHDRLSQSLSQNTSFNSNLSNERMNSSLISLSSLDKLNFSSSSSSLERHSSFSSHTSKEQAVYAIASTLSPEQRNGTLGGSVLLTAASKRVLGLERRASSSKSRDRKSDSEKEDRGGLVRNRNCRRRDSSLSPPRRSDRSRSRSWDRSLQRRSRSRDRDRDRSRAWRNKSPPSRRYDRDRRRSGSKSPLRRLRSHSRSPPPKARPGRYRNRSPPILRSRSRSPYDKNDKLSPLSGGGTPTQDSNHGDTDMRLSITSQSIQSVVSVKDSHFASKRRCRDFDEKGYCMRGELCPFDHGSDPVVLEDVALPPTLTFPPGNSSVLPPPPGLEVQILGPSVAATSVLPVRAPPILPPLHHRQPSHIRIPHPINNLAEYNPDAPSMEPRMWIRHPFRPPARGMLHGALRGSGPGQMPIGINNFSLHHQRELINVPVVEGDSYMPMNPNKRTHHADFSSEDISPLKQRQFDYSRLGPRRGPLNKGLGLGNCSLELKKIPPGLNNIAHLNNHFAKFGKIVNIQVCFEGDFEAALITFSSHAEASSAYKSTEAVLNNRFIKVFWHNSEKEVNWLSVTTPRKHAVYSSIISSPNGKQENVPPARPSAKERLGPPQLTQLVDPKDQNSGSVQELEKVMMTGHKITKTVYIPTALRKSEFKPVQENKVLITQSQINNSTPSANLLRTQEIQAAKDMLKKKREEKRKEAQRLTLHLCKRKQGLLDKSVNQQKSLIERLEKGNLTQEQRDSVLQTIKSLQENIDMMRKDIKKAVAMKNSTVKGALKVVTPQVFKKTREETQKQILDAELDIFNRQQEGKDTADLQKRVLELKKKAQRLGLLGQTRVIRGRGGIYRGRGRGGGPFTAHSSIDHRPTKLLVSGFESDDKTEVLAHFAKFGEIIDYVWDEVTPALVVNFKTRKEAENAMNKGRNFQDLLLTATWYNSGQQMSMRNSMMRSVLMMDEEGVGVLLDEQEEEDEELRINLESTEDFLLQDEEEEEDEDRTWRR